MSKSSQAAADTCCSVCGQGFVLDWERQTKVERAQALQEIARTLRGHHAKLAGPDAHPPCGFLVPESNGTLTFSGASIRGHAPSWAL